MPLRRNVENGQASPCHSKRNNLENSRRCSRRLSAAKKVNYREVQSTEDDEFSSPKSKKSKDENFKLSVIESNESDATNSDDDFIIPEKQTSTEKRKPSRSCTNSDFTKKETVVKSVFRPASLSNNIVKSELDLSDSDSDEAENNDQQHVCSVSKAPDSPAKVSGKELCENVKESNVSTSDNATLNVWMKNLNALGVDCLNSEVKHREVSSSKGKQLKKKSIPRTTSKINNMDVAKLLKIGETSDNSSSDDENWEKVVLQASESKGSESELPKQVEVTIELGDGKQKKRKFDFQDFVRKKMNRIRKEIQIDLHKVSLIGALAHGYYVNRNLNSEMLIAAALSIIPSTHCYPPKRTNLSYLEKLVTWFRNHAQFVSEEEYYPYPLAEAISISLKTGKVHSAEEFVYTFIVLCRSLGILTRLVRSLQFLSLKVSSSELLVNPKSSAECKNVSSTLVAESDKGTIQGPSGYRNKKKSQVLNENKSTKKGKGVSKSEIGMELSSKASSSHCQEMIGQVGKKPTTSRRLAAAANDVYQPGDGATSKSGMKPCSRKNKTMYPSKEAQPQIDARTKPSKTRVTPAPSTMTRSKRTSLKNVKYKDSSSEEEKQVKKGEKMDKKEKDERNIQVKEEKRYVNLESKKIVSSESDEHDIQKQKQKASKNRRTDTWMEVYLEDEEQWICVDILSGKIHCERHIEKNCTQPMLYVVAFNPDGSWKDVTKRYASSFLTVTRKQRVDPVWWEKLLRVRQERENVRSRAEDDILEKQLLEAPLPTSISEYKDHPLYALRRHLLKYQAIYPPTALPLGYIRGEPVYARECVKTLHSRETWIKEAKVVRVGEKPYKIVKARPKWDRQSQKVITDQPLELFGEWQIEDYVPPPAVDGKVPRNAYGNVELFLPSMLPKGTKHLQIPGLNKVAKKLGIDCASAITGWDCHGGWSHPVYDGFVVCEEYVETLLDAWQAENLEQERREREKREKRVYDNWRRLIRGLLIKQRLHAKYFHNLTEELPPDREATAQKAGLSAPKTSNQSRKKRKSTS